GQWLRIERCRDESGPFIYLATRTQLRQVELKGSEGRKGRLERSRQLEAGGLEGSESGEEGEEDPGHSLDQIQRDPLEQSPPGHNGESGDGCKCEPGAEEDRQWLPMPHHEPCGQELREVSPFRGEQDEEARHSRLNAVCVGTTGDPLALLFRLLGP